MADHVVSESERIRERVRRATAHERLLQRQIAQSRGRNLCETEEELKAQAVLSPQEMTWLANKIKQSSQTTLEDLRMLKQSLCSLESVSSFLKVGGALQALIGHLSGRKALHQLEAVYVCCNLALGDEHACSVVAVAAGPYLVELLNSQNVIVQEACAWSVGNLTAGSPHALQVLRSQGLVIHLTNCLQSPHSNVVEAAIYALCHLLQSSFTTSESLSKDEIQAMARSACGLIASYNATHWLIFLLSSSAWCDEILIERSFPSFCLDFLKENVAPQINDSTTLRSVTSLLRTVGNLCSEPSGDAALTVLKHNSFVPVLTALLSSTHSHLQCESRWLAANFLFHPSSNVVTAAHEIGLAQTVSFVQVSSQ